MVSPEATGNEPEPVPQSDPADPAPLPSEPIDALAATPADEPSPDEFLPPPRPTTPPVRMGFLKVLAVLSILAGLVYGIPNIAGRAGYEWESGRARAAMEALEKLDAQDIQNRSSALFRIATRAVSPAVVSIRTVVKGQGNEMGAGLGSGVVIDKQEGYVVTNYHVVRDAVKIVARLGRKAEVDAELVGSDERTDLAVIKIPGPIAVGAEWADSDKVDVGDWVIAIGSPYGLDLTVTAGIVSATNRNNLFIGDNYEDFIQTDAAINPGNSGGPLIDLKGKVVGINTAVITPRDGAYQAQGIGLAISANMAKRVVEQLIKNKRVVRGYLGILPDLGAPGAGDDGVSVGQVRPGSPADKAGIKRGDRIVAMAGKPVDNFGALRSRTFTIPVGEEVPVEVVRGKDKVTVTARIAEMPNFGPATVPSLGIVISEAPVRQGTQGVLIVEVRPGGAAARSGLLPGLLITAIGPDRVRNLADFDRAMAKEDLNRGIAIEVQDPMGRRASVPVRAR